MRPPNYPALPLAFARAASGGFRVRPQRRRRLVRLPQALRHLLKPRPKDITTCVPAAHGVRNLCRLVTNDRPPTPTGRRPPRRHSVLGEIEDGRSK